MRDLDDLLLKRQATSITRSSESSPFIIIYTGNPQQTQQRGPIQDDNRVNLSMPPRGTPPQTQPANIPDSEAEPELYIEFVSKRLSRFVLGLTKDDDGSDEVLRGSLDYVWRVVHGALEDNPKPRGYLAN